MINIIKKITVAFLALFVVAGVVAPTASALAATFNNDSRDYATLQVSNYTRNPGSNSNWTNSVSANAGEVVSFLMYYHNTASDIANNTRIRVQLPSGSFTSTSIQGEVWASNGSVVTGTASVNLTSGQTLTFIPGSVSWYPNQSSVAQSLPNGQNGSEIVSSNGLLIGDVAGGWAAQGYIVFRAQVGSGMQNNYNYNYNQPTVQVRSPYVTTRAANAVSRISALLRGAVNPNGALTTAWFEYGTTTALGNVTTTQSIGQTNYSNDHAFALSGLSAGTTYYYRAVAQNSYGTTYGRILSFTTLGTGAVNTSAPRVIVQRVSTVRSGGSITGADTSVLLDPSIDIVRPAAGDTITYTITYTNNTNTALKNARLHIVLPEEISFVESTVEPSSVADDEIGFDLGTLAARDSGWIELTLKVDKKTKTDSSLSIDAVLDYTNARGDAQTATAFLIFLVDGKTAGLASLASVFGTLLDNWFVDLVLGLLIGFGIYHFFVRQKDEEVLVK